MYNGKYKIINAKGNTRAEHEQRSDAQSNFSQVLRQVHHQYAGKN
jgi:hypothetical protein